MGINKQVSEEIANNAKAEMGKVSALDSQVSEEAPFSNWKLRQAMYKLKDVETVLLAHAAKAPRDVDATKWIGVAKSQIAGALKLRLEVQEHFNKFGPNMVEIG